MNNVIQKARELLKELEGLYLVPYRCPAGKWTIGYGHNLEANGLTVDEAKRVEFDTDVIESSTVGRWCRSGLGTREVKDILPRHIKAIKITEETAEYILDNDINGFVNQLSKTPYFNCAPDNVQVALICISFQCGFAGMHTKIYIDARKLPGSGYPEQERKYFIDSIRKSDYSRASIILRHARIFDTTKKRAIKMAELIHTD